MAERPGDLTGEYEQDRTLIEDWLEQLTRSFDPIDNFRGKRHSVTIAAGPGTVSITHQLNKEPRGWQVVKTTTAIQIYETARDKTTLTLKIDSGSFTGEVLVF